MSFIDAIIFGVVEGVTEFLPVSSTGHLILVADLLHLPETDFLKTFQIVIQLGAIGGIIMLYWRKLLLDRLLMQKIVVALLPALGIGFVLYRFIRSLFESSLTVVMALFVGGLILVIFEYFHQKKGDIGKDLETLSYTTAFGIGLFQTLSVIPGVSRAGATIVGGLALGLTRKAIVEFSFLLAVPTMLAATALDLWKHGATFSGGDLVFLLTGFATAFVVAIFTVKVLLRFIETHSFIAFGVYRMIIALVFYFFIL